MRRSSTINKLERVDVQINHDFDQSLTNSQKGQKEGQGWNQEANGDGFAAERAIEGSPSELLNMEIDRRLLHLVA